MTARRAAGSFRDPAGTLHWHEDSGTPRLLRVVQEGYAPHVRAFIQSEMAREAMEAGELVRSRVLSPAEAGSLQGGLNGESSPATEHAEGEAAGLVLEHEVVPFRSYPSEWPPAMLHAAARLTVELGQRGMAEGHVLKDATPRNVLFRGPNPVFVDIPSFEPRDQGVPVWPAYSQFLQGFLLPLLLHRELGLDPRRFASPAGDGVTPADAMRALPWVRRFFPRPLALATAPALLARRGRRLRSQGRGLPRLSPEAGDAALRRQFRSAGKHLQALAPLSPGARSSSWVGYQDDCHYTEEDRGEKRRVVERVLADEAPEQVLDLGCNQGEFSEMAARSGAQVVALDSDPQVVEGVWQRSRREALDILPLAVDLADPTPAAGWRNGEQKALLERLSRRFHVVLALALVHHLLVTQRIPLDEILELLEGFVAPEGVVVVEYVPPQDPRFRELAWGREELFTDHTLERFQQAFHQRFKPVDDVALPDSERVLLVGRRPPRRGEAGPEQ